MPLETEAQQARRASIPVEHYYGAFNDRDWSAIAAMFDRPATIIVGPRKTLLHTQDAVIALYRALGERMAQEGAVRVSWDRGSFAPFQVHDDLAVVKTVLAREAADGTPIKTWSCSYTVRLVGRDWLITLMTSDDTGNVREAT
jgi:hypothetical protein